MKRISLFLWQLPQNLLGFLIIKILKCKKIGCYWFAKNKTAFSVSLGNYIIFCRTSKMIFPSDDSILHEKGHQIQSLYLGWLYLLVIGLPSFLGNVYNRIFHKNWSNEKRLKWYYSQLWEKWADNLGYVKRSF